MAAQHDIKRLFQLRSAHPHEPAMAILEVDRVRDVVQEGVQQIAFISQRRERPAQFPRAFLDPPFEVFAGGLQRLFPLLNLGEDVIEPVDQVSQLVVSLFEGSHGIVPFFRDPRHRLRQIREGF
jgi:hypothetical protein